MPRKGAARKRKTPTPIEDGGASKRMRETSEENSCTSNSSLPIRRTSARISKPSARYTEYRHCLAGRRKRVCEISDKSRSTTDIDDMKECKFNVPEIKGDTITEVKVRISIMPVVAAVKTEMETRPLKSMRDAHEDERLKIEVVTNSSNSLDIAVISPKESNEVLIENTPPTTPDKSSNYPSEDQDMNSGKHPPNIESDLVDLDDERKDSGGCASSSGCKQRSASDNPHAETTVSDHDGAINRSKSSSGQKKMDRENNKRQGNLPSNYNNEKEEDHDIKCRKSRRSSSKHKPKKKKSKFTPELPSAPRPFLQGELDGLNQDERIAVLQARMVEMHTYYRQVKQMVSKIDRHLKLKKKELEGYKPTLKLTKSRRKRK